MLDNTYEVFPVDELLHSAHPREILPLFCPDVPRGGPIFNRREHKPFFFGNNPYENPRNAYSLRFGPKRKLFIILACCTTRLESFNINTLICLRCTPHHASR